MQNLIDKSHDLFFVFIAFGFLFPLALLSVGCQIIQTATHIPEKAFSTVIPGLDTGTKVDPVEVQERLLRFADQFATAMITGIEKLKRSNDKVSTREALQWKILFATETSSIAVGSNPIANLLDMTVFVTVTREIIENDWQSNRFGESVKPLLETSRVYETEIWKITGLLLKPEQQSELRKAIDAWQKEHPVSANFLDNLVVGFAQEVYRAQRTDTSQSSVFGLLGLDPLSGLDPATREIAETRLFAERALFITRWMPYLLRWQTELLSIDTMTMPQMQQLIANTGQFSASTERFANLAEQLPDQLAAQREQILNALASQEQDLSMLSAEVRRTFVAGTEMSNSVDTTLTTFNALMQRFGVGEPHSHTPPEPDAEPFRILDYAQTATQLEAASRELTELVRTLNGSLATSNLQRVSVLMGPIVERAQTGGKTLVDYAFRQAILFLVIACALVLLTIDVNRRLRLRHEKQRK